MNKSESIKELASALVKFNGEVSRITKDAKNPHFKNTYASIDQIVDEIRPLLQKHGLSILQFPSGDGDRVTMTTILLHESGEWIQGDPLTMVPVKKDPQGIGSCITYARRYSLSAFLSLNTGEDDDGNEASTPDKKQSNSKLPVLKAKWQQLAGSLDGFDAWHKGQLEKGVSEQQMDTFLTKKIKEKAEGVAS